MPDFFVIDMGGGPWCSDCLPGVLKYLERTEGKPVPECDIAKVDTNHYQSRFGKPPKCDACAKEGE
jgi:hypothetical protein